MALYGKGIMGTFNGKVGTVIGSMWKGLYVMRSVPTRVANPNTLAQQAQRARFKLLTAFINANAKFFRIGFGARDVRMSEINAAYKQNYPVAISGIFPTLSIDVKKLIPSMGLLPKLKDFAAESTVANTIAMTWVDDSGTDDKAKGTDKISVAAFDEATGESFTLLNLADRVDESLTLNLPSGWSGKSVTVYAFLITEKAIGKINTPDQVSESVSVNGLNIA